MKKFWLVISIVLCMVLCFASVAIFAADGGIQITVKTMTGKQINLTVEPGDTILKVKTLISEKEGIPPAQQRLTFNNQELDEDKTLAEYNITKGSEIKLTLRLVKTVSTGEELKAALTGTAICTVKLTSDITVNETMRISKGSSVILDLNGYVLNLGRNKSIIVNDGEFASRLTIIDSRPDAEHKFTLNDDGLWLLDEADGTKTVKGGVITGGDNNGGSECGGGIDVGRNGTVIMEAGNIVGCYANGHGGAVHVGGTNGTFIMNGGSIAGCKAGSMGGGVSLDSSGGSFTMNGGTMEYPVRYFYKDMSISDKIEPTKEGCIFDGWYKSDGTKWNCTSDVVTEDMTLTAMWKHIHCICGGSTTVGDHTSHTDIDWIPWISTDSLPTAAGNYYLVSDVTLPEGNVAIPDGVNICLNGNKINDGKEYAVYTEISVADSGTFSVTDCGTTGGFGNFDMLDGKLVMYGGKIVKDSALRINNGTSFLMTGNAKNEGVIVIKGSANFTMNGNAKNDGFISLLETDDKGTVEFCGRADGGKVVVYQPKQGAKIHLSDNAKIPEMYAMAQCTIGLVMQNDAEIGKVKNLEFESPKLSGNAKLGSDDSIFSISTPTGNENTFTVGDNVELIGTVTIINKSATQLILKDNASVKGSLTISNNAENVLFNIQDDVTIHGDLKCEGIAIEISTDDTIIDGDIDIGDSKVSSGKLTCSGEIKSGSFNDEVVNSGKITGGIFYGTVTGTGIIEDSAKVDVVFNTDNGSSVTTQKILRGQKATKPADLTKTGYSFGGWLNGDLVYNFDEPVIDDITLKAKWTINQYTITVKPGNGEADIVIKKDYGTAVTAPTLTRTGYTFAGWDTTFPTTMPAENVTITAKWTINQYTITVKPENGEADIVIKQDYGTAVTAPTLTRTGYTFTGWDTTFPATIPAENVTITAKWTINQYMITVKPGNGEADIVIKQDYGTAVTAPTLTRTGYTFTGWDVAFPTTMPAENVTITAKWTVNQYTITVKPGNGEADIVIKQDYGTEVTTPTLTRTGYTFTGWDATFPTTMPAENVTITAKWRDIEKPTGDITIGTYKWHVFLGELTSGVFFNVKQTVTINAADNSGTVFAGYYVTDEDLSESDLKSLLFKGYDGSFDIEANGKYIVYVMLVDESLNITYLRSDRITIDNVPPIISGIENGKIYCSSKTVTITEENLHGVYVNNEPVYLDENNSFVLAFKVGKQTISVYDKAGNVAEMTVTINNGHTPEADDGDCTTPIYCEICNAEVVAAQKHDFSGTWHKDDDGHWHVCENEDCNVSDAKTAHSGTEDGDCTTAIVCECGYIIKAAQKHDFSGAWRKDDDGHWHVCENEDCNVTDTKTAHSGTDDGDCTTAIVCECGYVIKAAGSHHNLGKWRYSGGDVHTRKCNSEDCVYSETEDCSGGKATCMKKAVCEVCGASYGKFNEDNHTGKIKWVYDSETHKAYYSCCNSSASGEEKHSLVNGKCDKCGYGCAHEGGKATCTKKAVCTICGCGYGTLDTNNHIGKAEWNHTASSHEEKYSCCGAVITASEKHEWKDGVCGKCGYECVHEGGKATCAHKAVCSACGCGYGDINPNAHEKLKRVPATAATAKNEGVKEHWICEACGKLFAESNGKTELKTDDTVIEKLEPQVNPQGSGKWTKGDDSSLIFDYDGDAETVLIDGKTSDGVTVKDGIIEINKDTLKDLSKGKHTLTVVSTEGKKSSVEFEILADDFALISIVLIASAVVAVVGAGGVIIVVRRKKTER